MTYDEGLAHRVRIALEEQADIEEKEMFGGIAFMISGNMCCAIIDDSLVARVGAAEYESALAKSHVRPMDFTGKPMTGFVFVDPPGLATDSELQTWLDLCINNLSSISSQ